jgi:prophage regulatory protein
MKTEIDPLIDRREVCRLTSLSRSQIYRLERVGKFPERLQIGPGRVAWLQSEISDWIASKTTLRSHARRWRPDADVLLAVDPSPLTHPPPPSRQI